MRKLFFRLTMLVAVTALFTACDNDDNKPRKRIQFYSEGAFIVNSGNMYNKIDGSLTAINYKTNQATQQVFKTANGVSLGNTPNDGLIYGSKIYVAVDQENTVEVIDKTTFKRIKQIKTTDLLGTDEGKSPRQYKVGNYPEGMLIVGNNLFVANSNYGKGGGNISIINLGNGSVTTKDVKGVNNPQSFYIGNDRQLYVLDWATYDASFTPLSENNLRRINNDFTSDKVADANYVAVSNGIFLAINAPYGQTATYKIYTPANNSTTDWKLSEPVAYPCGVAVDPVKGGVFVLSYNKSADGNMPDYNGNGYVNCYDGNGTKKATYNVGVGPVTIFFDAGYHTITE